MTLSLPEQGWRGKGSHLVPGGQGSIKSAHCTSATAPGFLEHTGASTSLFPTRTLGSQTGRLQVGSGIGFRRLFGSVLCVKSVSEKGFFGEMKKPLSTDLTAYFGILTDPTCSTSIRKLSPDSNPSLPHIQPEHCRLLPSEYDMQGWEGAQLAHPPACLPLVRRGQNSRG